MPVSKGHQYIQQYHQPGDYVRYEKIHWFPVFCAHPWTTPAVKQFPLLDWNNLGKQQIFKSQWYYPLKSVRPLELALALILSQLLLIELFCLRDLEPNQCSLIAKKSHKLLLFRKCRGWALRTLCCTNCMWHMPEAKIMMLHHSLITGHCPQGFHLLLQGFKHLFNQMPLLFGCYQCSSHYRICYGFSFPSFTSVAFLSTKALG